MLYARDRQRPIAGRQSLCPCCNQKVVAKCGDIKVHHWAHANLSDCDAFYEPMTQWHVDWQGLVKERCREVIIGGHRADIQLNDGRVFEVQHSTMPILSMLDREEFYGADLTWIFDAEPFQKRFGLKEKVSQAGNEYVSWSWSRSRHYVTHCARPVWLDFGSYVVEVEKFNSYMDREDSPRRYGWGHRWDKNELLYRKLFGEDYINEKSKDKNEERVFKEV